MTHSTNFKSGILRKSWQELVHRISDEIKKGIFGKLYISILATSECCSWKRLRSFPMTGEYRSFISFFFYLKTKGKIFKIIWMTWSLRSIFKSNVGAWKFWPGPFLCSKSFQNANQSCEVVPSSRNSPMERVSDSDPKMGCHCNFSENKSGKITAHKLGTCH